MPDTPNIVVRRTASGYAVYATRFALPDAAVAIVRDLPGVMWASVNYQYELRLYYSRAFTPDEIDAAVTAVLERFAPPKTVPIGGVPAGRIVEVDGTRYITVSSWAPSSRRCINGKGYFATFPNGTRAIDLGAMPDLDGMEPRS